jgi:hypothetical protein
LRYLGMTKKISNPKSGDTAEGKITYLATVKSESADSMHLRINGSEMTLETDNDTSSGKLKLDQTPKIDVNFSIDGLDGTDWTFELDIDCDAGPAKVLDAKGEMGKPNGRGFDKSVDIPAMPCAAK